MTSSVTGGDKLGPYLTNLVAKAGRGGTLRVGFLPGSVYPNGISVAAVAIAQNFGDPARNIPARPFFSNLARSQRAEWSRRLKQHLSRNDFNTYDALEVLGTEIVSEVQDSIRTFVGVPLSPRTIRRKGHDKQLIDTRRMLESVSFSVGSSETDAGQDTTAGGSGGSAATGGNVTTGGRGSRLRNAFWSVWGMLRRFGGRLVGRS